MRGVIAGRGRRQRAVVDDRQLSIGAQVDAVVAAVDPERLAQLAGPVGEEAIRLAASAAPHDLDTAQRDQPSQQDGLGIAVGAGDHIGAEVHAVREVDVEVSGRPEHRRVARRSAAEGMAGGVVGAIRLDFDDAPCARSRDEDLVEERRCQLDRAALEELALEPLLRHARRACRSSSSDAKRAIWSAERTGPGTAGRCAPLDTGAGVDESGSIRAESLVAMRQLAQASSRLEVLADELDRRWRAPRGTACRCARAIRRGRLPPQLRRRLPQPFGRRRTSRSRSSRPSRRAPVRPGRRSRTAAPCLPAGHGCRRAEAPSTSPAGRSGCRSGAPPCPEPARRCRGSSSEGASTTRSRSASSRRAKPNSSLVHSTHSSPSRARCRPRTQMSNSASATKSRSLTASSELANTSGEAERLRRRRGIDRQRCPRQRACTERRHIETLDSARRAGRRPAPAPTRGPAGGGRAAPAGPVADGCSRGGRRHLPPRRGRARPAAGRSRGVPLRAARACTTGAGPWRPGRCGCAPCGASHPPVPPARWSAARLRCGCPRPSGRTRTTRWPVRSRPGRGRAEWRLARSRRGAPPVASRRHGREIRRCPRATAGGRTGG